MDRAVRVGHQELVRGLHGLCLLQGLRRGRRGVGQRHGRRGAVLGGIRDRLVGGCLQRRAPGHQLRVERRRAAELVDHVLRGRLAGRRGRLEGCLGTYPGVGSRYVVGVPRRDGIRRGFVLGRVRVVRGDRILVGGVGQRVAQLHVVVVHLRPGSPDAFVDHRLQQGVQVVRLELLQCRKGGLALVQVAPDLGNAG